MQTDGQTDMTKLIVAFCDCFENATKLRTNVPLKLFLKWKVYNKSEYAVQGEPALSIHNIGQSL